MRGSDRPIRLWVLTIGIVGCGVMLGACGTSPQGDADAFCDRGFRGLVVVVNPLQPLLQTIHPNTPDASRAGVSEIRDQIADIREEVPERLRDEIAQIQSFYTDVAERLEDAETPKEFHQLALATRDGLASLGTEPTSAVFDYFQETCEGAADSPP